VAFNISYNFVAIDRFSAQARKIKSSVRSYTQSIEKARAENDRFNGSIKRYGRSISSVGKKMTVGVTLPAILMGRSMVNAASDAEETRNKFNEVFRGFESEGASAVQNLSDKFDLAKSTSRELLSSTGDLLVGLGLTGDEALKLSQQVVSLSADVASFKNVQGGTERAANALTKALLGEKEMLKDTFKSHGYIRASY